jgi:hypothetical protein
VGPYEVSVEKRGFADTVRKVQLTVGAAFDLPFSLAVGQMETKVEVSGEAPVLEAARTQIASTISPNEIANLPLSGRNYLDIALFVPEFRRLIPRRISYSRKLRRYRAREFPSAASAIFRTASLSTA